MPKSEALLATMAPIAPKPITPRVLPRISGPTNWDFPFSAKSGISLPLPAKACTHSEALITGRLAMRSDSNTNSRTALALAPGVLNTTIPRSVIAGIGMLFVPAPARAMAFTDSGTSMECISAERSKIASG